MSLPTTHPLYRHKKKPGLYKIAYQSVSGAGRIGIPHDDKTDIMTLELAYSEKGAALVIVCSLAEFEDKFERAPMVSETTTVPPLTGTPDDPA